MRNRKETAWKKNRKFGDVLGGRKWPKIADKVWRRFHSLRAPGPNDQIPIFIQDNPSRDFFFPVGIQDVKSALKQLPEDDVQGITHIWFRRIRKSDYEEGNLPFASFLFGGGVRLIVLYPWPTQMQLWCGRRKPRGKFYKEISGFAEEWVEDDGGWWLRFEEEGLRRYYIEVLLFHEVGHHVDAYRRRITASNVKQLEDFADQYAIHWSQKKKYLVTGKDLSQLD